MKYNILLLSGGTRVAVHVGAYRAIQDAGASAAAWAGVSAGSLVASVFASGQTVEQAFDLMLKTDYRQFLDVRPLTLIRRFGLFAGERFESWLNGVLGGRRFRDLDVPLSIVATEIATGEPFIFSNTTTPEVKLATAVRCSIGIPGIFAVRQVEGRAMFDGCFASLSRHALFPDPATPSLLVRMNNVRSASALSGPPRRLNVAHYIFRVAEIVLNNLRELYDPQDWDAAIRIDVGPISGVKFALTPAEKRELCDRGYDCCSRQLRAMLAARSQSHQAGSFTEIDPFELLHLRNNSPARVLVPS